MVTREAPGVRESNVAILVFQSQQQKSGEGVGMMK
jgi:hypothetical protein